jgi:hypothetical protein
MKRYVNTAREERAQKIKNFSSMLNLLVIIVSSCLKDKPDRRYCQKVFYGE